jgi:CHAD domain-containing protein
VAVLRSDEQLTVAMTHEVEHLVGELARDLRAARRAKVGGVHRTRTDLRRIRGVVEFMGRTLWAGAGARRLRRRLRRTEKSLARVRDADVMLGVLDDYCRSHRSDRAGLERLVRTLRKRRNRAADRTADVGRRLPRRVRSFANDHARTAPRRAPRLVREFAREEIWRRYDAVRAYETHPPADPDGIHKYRSACRELRFCLESFAGAFPRLGQLAEVLHGLQSDLGDLHDHHVAAMLVRRWLERGKIDRTQAARNLARWAVSERERLRRRTARQRQAVVGRAFRVHLSRALETERRGY